MAEQNQTISYQGTNVVLDIRFYDSNASLADPDVIPTVQIYNPSNTLIITGQGNKLALGYWDFTYFIPITAPIGQWKIVWTATISSISVLNNVEYFEVRTASEQPQTQQIIISDEWLRQIKRVMAFPGVDNILLTDEEIKEFCLWPSLYEYFRKFPLKDRQEYATDGEVSFPFPDNLVFGCNDVRAVEKFGGTSTASSFYDIIRYQTLYGGNLRFSGVGSYGTRYNFNGLRQEYQRGRQVAETMSNQFNTFKYFINYQQRQVEVFTSVSCKVVIDWARYSLNFADVKHSRIQQTIMLAQSFLLNHLADAAMLLDDTQLDKRFNTENIRTRATELYDKVITEGWAKEPDLLYMRVT